MSNERSSTNGLQVQLAELQAENEQLRQQLATQQQAEAQLRQNQQRLEYALEGSNSGLWDWLIPENQAVLSDRYREILGYRPDELPDSLDSWMNSIHPDDMPAVQRTVEEYLAGQRSAYMLEHRLRHKSGEWRWMLSRGKIVARSDDGQPLRMTGTVTDITEQKQREMSERQLNTIIGNSNDFIGIATLDGKVGHLNPAGRAMVGLDQGQDLSAIPIEEFHPPEDIALLQETIVPTVLQQGVWSGEFRLRHFQTGATIPVSYSLFQLEDPYTGEVNALGCISRDITEQKQQQTDLEMFRTLVENAPDAISVANLAGTEVYANPVFRERTGYGDQVIGMSIPELYNEPAAAIQQIVQHVMEHGFWQGENSYRRSDKQVMPNLASIFLIHNEDGTPQFIAAIESDITEQKQQQAELEMFRALVENALDGIAYSTPDGIMLYSNASYAAMTGFGDQVAGSTIADYYEPEDAAFVAQTVIPAVIQEGNWQGTLRLRRPNGEHWIGQANLITLKGDAGEITHFIATFRDITQQIADEEERRALAQQVIDAQRDALRELSTPLLPISDDVVIMPLIGTIDSRRAQQVMEALLEGVARHQSRLVILDITGVQVVDTQVAQAFIQAAQAVKLLGATVMLTGIQPQIAQTLVGLGIDLSGIQTQGSLQAGIATALGHTDFRVASRQPGQPA